jgi:hypothetical protein
VVAASFSVLAAVLLVAGSALAQEASHGKSNKDGNIQFADPFNNQVIQVNAAGNIVFSYGIIGISGDGANELNAPYDANCICDYTGITKPPTPPGAALGGSGF